MPSASLFSLDSLEFTTIPGTSSGTVYPLDYPTSRFLTDQNDNTYVQIVGNDAAGQSYLVSFGTTIHDQAQSILSVMPTNSTNLVATFVLRIRNADTGCPLAGFNSFIEVWGNDQVSPPFPELSYGSVTIPSNSFTNVEVALPTTPLGAAWTPAYAGDQSAIFFGLKANTSCFSSSTPLDAGADWSEGSIRIDFRLPAPILTLSDPTDVGAYAATLTGIVNPNQDGLELTTEYPLDFGFTLGLDPNALPTVTYTGTVTNGGTNDVRVFSPVFSRLIPNATYYFKLVARDQEGYVTESSVGSFTTPLYDPVKGVY